MGQQISVQIEQSDEEDVGVKGGGSRLSLTPTPRKLRPSSVAAALASPLADSTNNVGVTGVAAGGGPPLLGQPSPDDDSVIDLCDSPPTASTPPNTGKSSTSASSSNSNRLVLIEIPDDVTRCLLTSLSLSSLVKLSVCSKTLAESVYSRSYLWEKIDLETLSYRQRQALNDRSLHRLLKAVNAKEVTKSLSIRYCTNIQGFGLEPLRGSHVLEELDLRKKHQGVINGTGLEESFVLSLLKTMMPFARPNHDNCRSGMTSRLFTIRFNAQKKPPLVNGVNTANRIQDCFHLYGEVKKFFDSFDGSLKDRLWIDRVSCSHCDTPIVEKIPSAQFETKEASALRCFECSKISCGQNECPSTKRCQKCFSDLCCARIDTCDKCRITMCSSCYGIEKCQGQCSRNLCECCCSVLDCDYCNKSFCEECKDLMFCHKCDKFFCPECVEVSPCGDGYGDCWFCSQCIPDPNECSRCESVFCTDCDPDELALCDGCDKLVCIYCEDLSDPCGGCKGMFCSKCREISPKYDCCDEQYCHSCLPNFEECSLCRKCSLCCSDLSECSKCTSWYGDKCVKVDGCRDCGLTVCGYCSFTDSKGGLSPCSYCHELICPTCRKDTQVSGAGLSVHFCNDCSENVQATSIAGGDDSSSSKSGDRQRSRKNKADMLSTELCELKLERARARRRLEAATENIRRVEEKLLISDPGWFPADSDL